MRGHTITFEKHAILTIICSGYGVLVTNGNAKNDATKKNEKVIFRPTGYFLEEWIKKIKYFCKITYLLL